MTRYNAMFVGLALALGAAAFTSRLPAQNSASPAPEGPADVVVAGADAIVTLPLCEFEALLAAGSAGAARRGPPAPFAVREARYVCEALDARDGAVRVAATLELEVLADGYQAVPIGGGVVLEKARLDDKDVLMVAADGADRNAVLVPSRGRHTLELAFVVPAPATPSGTRRMGFGIARSPVNRVLLRVSQAPRAVQALGGVVASTAKRDAHTEVQMLWPPADQVSVVWSEPQPAPIPSASAVAPVLAPRVEARLLSRYAFKLDRIAIDAQAVIAVSQGSLAEVKIQVPPGCRLMRVREQNGETTPRHTIETSAAGTLITVRPQAPIIEEKRYRLELEQPYPEPVRLAPEPATSATLAAMTVSAAAPPAPPPGAPPGLPRVASPAAPATATASPPLLGPALPPGPVASASVAASPAATSTAASVTRTAPPPLPPVTVPLAFISMPGIDNVNGEFTLAVPASPLQLEAPDPRDPVRRAVSLSAGNPSGPSFAYTGTPAYAVTLCAERTGAQSPVSVPEVRARTLVLSEGGFLTRANWMVVNRREPVLSIALPPGAEVLTAFLDGEPVRLGARNAPAGTGGRPGEVRLPPGLLLGSTSGMSGERSGDTSSVAAGVPATSAAPSEKTTPAWVELAVPLRQDPDRPANLEVTYRQPAPVLGSRDHLLLSFPRTQSDVTILRWDVDVPAGFQASASSPSLRVSEQVELRGQGASAVSTGARLDPRAAEPTPSTTGAAAAPRFELPEPSSGTRIPLAGDSLKAGATPECQITTVSVGLQQFARALVFLLTLIALSEVFWFSSGSSFTIGASVVLAGTVLVSLWLGLAVMGHLVAGVVAALTFKLIRLLMDPVEEKEAP